MKIALLIKDQLQNTKELDKYYINPLEAAGIPREDITIFELKYDKKKDVSAAFMKIQLHNILPLCRGKNIDTLLVADSKYFKCLTKVGKVDPNYGYVKECKLKDYEEFKAIIAPNYKALFYNPELQKKIQYSLTTLINYYRGTYEDPGKDIIHYADYPSTTSAILTRLQEIYNTKAVTCDIETNGLKLGPVVSIAFAVNKHNGIAFKVNEPGKRRDYLRQFFEAYKGALIFHNATFDTKQLIFDLYMDLDLTKYDKALDGLEVFYRDIHDTKIITYLATNSTNKPPLGLKPNAQEFAGNYAIDSIENASDHPLEELLEYNLRDCLATWYVYEKYMNKMIQDDQYTLYTCLMLPMLKLVTNMELVGLPLNWDNVNKLTDEIEGTDDKKGIIKRCLDELAGYDFIKNWSWLRQVEAYQTKIATLKKLINPLEDFVTTLNPNSNQQLQSFIYSYLNLPIIEKTDSGAPATGQKTLQKLVNHLIEEYDISDMEKHHIEEEEEDDIE